MEVERPGMSWDEKMYSSSIRKALHHLEIFQFVSFAQS